ncbi:MAG: sulfatase, partial [Proteobacteria bacterium]|nr:sulfatase [Pseudomonadota bacterium]
RNYYPKRPYLQPCAYKDKKEILTATRRLFAAGKLNRDQSLIMAAIRPKEELYDLRADPFELHNLAGRESHAATLGQLRETLDRWIKETGDRGESPEPDAMYDSDMAVYVDAIRRRGGAMMQHAKVIQANIALMKRWQAEGK